MKDSTLRIILKCHAFNRQFPKNHQLVDFSEKRMEAAQKLQRARHRRQQYGGVHPIHAISPLIVHHA